MRTFPDVLAVLTQTAAHRGEVGGRKSSTLFRPQFWPPLSLAVSVGVSLRPIRCESPSIPKLARTLLLPPTSVLGTDSSRSQPVSRFFSAGAASGDASTRTRRDAPCSRRGRHRPVTAAVRVEDWRERPEGFVEFVHAHHVPNFVEYGEYPYVTSEKVNNALRLKPAFSDMLDQMQ
jgi:hypothetical protein